jgi:hypothetical protein
MGRFPKHLGGKKLVTSVDQKYGTRVNWYTCLHLHIHVSQEDFLWLLLSYILLYMFMCTYHANPWLFIFLCRLKINLMEELYFPPLFLKLGWSQTYRLYSTQKLSLSLSLSRVDFNVRLWNVGGGGAGTISAGFMVGPGWDNIHCQTVLRQYRHIVGALA